MIDCHASPKPRPLRLRGPNHPHHRFDAVGPSCTKPQTSERHGEKNETVKPPKNRGPWGWTPISRPPAGRGHAPFVKSGLGDPHTPHCRAPAPCLRSPGFCLGLRTTLGQLREGTQSAGPGHLFPRPAPGRPPAPPTACGGHSPGPAALAPCALSPAAGPGPG